MWVRTKSKFRMMYPLLLIPLSGCGSGIHSLPGATTSQPQPGYVYLTGNWQFAVSNPTGRATFSALAGYLEESSSGTGTSHDATAVLQVTPGNCFVGETTLPAYGTVNSSAVSFRSFSDDGQFVTISGTEDATATHFTGSFSVGGGCSNGGGGTLTGTRYAPLSGTYTGLPASTGPPQIASVQLTQAAEGNGKGFSFLNGTAAFTGISCFSTGALDPDRSSVLGSAIEMNVIAGDGETVLLHGTFDPAASSVSITSGTVSGGACAGPLGQATLAKS